METPVVLLQLWQAEGLGSEPSHPEPLMLLSTGHDQCQGHSLNILPHLCFSAPNKVGSLKTKLGLIPESIFCIHKIGRSEKDVPKSPLPLHTVTGSKLIPEQSQLITVP